jgi:hypothetical protein
MSKNSFRHHFSPLTAISTNSWERHKVLAQIGPKINDQLWELAILARHRMKIASKEA